MNIRELTKEELAEESLIDLAFAILNEKKAPLQFLDLLKEIQNLNGLSDEEIQSRLVQFYTDMNIDGRFLVNTENGWGLREWYKVETIEEETAPTVKTRKRKSKAAVEDEDDLLVDEEDLVFEEDFDEFVDEEEVDEEEEDLDFEEEEDIDSLDVDGEIDDVDVDVDVDDEIIDEDESFIIEDDELEEEDDEVDEEEDEDLK